MGFTGTAGFLKQHGGMSQLTALIGRYVGTTTGGHARRNSPSKKAPGGNKPTQSPRRKTLQGVYPIVRPAKAVVSAGVRFCAVRPLLKSTHWYCDVPSLSSKQTL